MAKAIQYLSNIITEWDHYSYSYFVFCVLCGVLFISLPLVITLCWLFPTMGIIVASFIGGFLATIGILIGCKIGGYI